MLLALRSGGIRNSLTSVSWEVSGNCQSPVDRVVTSRGGRNIKTRFTGLEVNMTVRCRKCDKCRQLRRLVWTNRAKHEVQTSHRTWFGTLTLRPEEHYRFLCRARAKADARIENFDGLPYWQQFSLRHAAINPELTKYLKRIREQSNAPLRYLLVAEAHKSGAPHYHMLVHEVDPDRPIRHSVLSAQWGLGFSQWKLVSDTRSATYLCKYLSKSNAARVRASLRYGRNDPEWIADQQSQTVHHGLSHRNPELVSCQTHDPI